MAGNRKLRTETGIEVEGGFTSFDMGRCSEDELAERLSLSFPGEMRSSVGVLAIWTDEVQGATYGELEGLLADADRLAHLLELRVFLQDREIHVLRDMMGVNFSWRLAVDGEATSACVGYFDEDQYLDIDGSWALSGRKADGDSYEYKTASGGRYRLPLAEAERIRIRNYLAYDEDGLAYVTDYRIVKLLAREEE